MADDGCSLQAEPQVCSLTIVLLHAYSHCGSGVGGTGCVCDKMTKEGTSMNALVRGKRIRSMGKGRVEIDEQG